MKTSVVERIIKPLQDELNNLYNQLNTPNDNPLVEIE